MYALVLNREISKLLNIACVIALLRSTPTIKKHATEEVPLQLVLAKPFKIGAPT